MGKFRPHIMVFCVPLVLSAVLAFSPAGLRGTNGALIWAVVTCFLLGSVFYTLVNILTPRSRSSTWPQARPPPRSSCWPRILVQSYPLTDQRPAEILLDLRTRKDTGILPTAARQEMEAARGAAGASPAAAPSSADGADHAEHDGIPPSARTVRAPARAEPPAAPPPCKRGKVR